MYALDKAKAKWRGFLFDSNVRSESFGSVSEKIESKNKSSQDSTSIFVRQIDKKQKQNSEKAKYLRRILFLKSLQFERNVAISKK